MKTVTVRVLSSMVYGPVMLICAWLGGYVLQALLSIVIIFGMHELFSIIRDHRNVTMRFPFLLIAALIISWLIFYSGLKYVTFLYTFFLFFFVALDVFSNKIPQSIERISYSMFSLMYLPLMLSFLYLIRSLEHGRFLLIILYGSIWLTDSAAYFLGAAFGKHKNIFSSSKNKSLEGFIAGFITAFVSVYLLNQLVYLIFGYYALYSWLDILVFGFIVGFLGQLGDLIESILKRDLEVKDTSNLIPGHGGILDRFDSLLISAPFLYFYFSMTG